MVSRCIIALNAMIRWRTLEDGQWLHYVGHLKPAHTQPLTAEIIQGSVTQQVLFVRQNKQQSIAWLQD